MSIDMPHIVIDTGSALIKAGYNGENAPRVVVPTVLGTQKPGLLNLLEDETQFYVGKEAVYNSSYLSLHYPIQNGKFPTNQTDVDYAEKILTHIFEKELKVKQENYNIFLIDSLFSSQKEREKMAELMFETFAVFNIHIEPQSVMTLYSTAKSSGVIIESGYTMTEIVPIFEGYLIPQGVMTSPIGGRELTKQLQNALKQEFENYDVANPTEMARKIKESVFEIPLKGTEMSREMVDPLKYELPDGNSIDIGIERFSIPESIFNPDLIESDAKPLHKLIYESIQRVDIHLRRDFLNNIILGGGNSMIKNFPERLKSELSQTLVEEKWENSNVKVQAFPERCYSAWIGASGVCSFSKFQDKWISKPDYEEVGKHIISQNYLFSLS